MKPTTNEQRIIFSAYMNANTTNKGKLDDGIRNFLCALPLDVSILILVKLTKYLFKRSIFWNPV